MSKTQENLIRNWYERGKEGQTTSIRADKKTVCAGYDTIIARKMADGFVAVNTDILSIPRGGRMFHSAINAVGNRGLSVSFEALYSTNIPWDELRLVYKTPEQRSPGSPQLILGAEGTQRSLLMVRDRAWVGLVETQGFYRDPLKALASLVPDKIKSLVDEKENITLYPSSKKEVFRHGEYYFIPRPEFKPPKDKIEKWKAIDETDLRPHKVRDKAVVDGVTYIRGTIRHQARRMISCRFWSPIQNPNGGKKLVELWYEVVKSNQVGSWKGRNFWG